MLIEAVMWTAGLGPLSDVLRGRRSGKIEVPFVEILGIIFVRLRSGKKCRLLYSW